jgi:hypothetical protein
VIYQDTAVDAPIRQGDIFTALPRIEISLDSVVLFDENGDTSNCGWRDIARAGRETAIVLPVRPVTAIVATQDCDAARSDDITLCEIRTFREVEGKAAQTTSPKSWTRIITQHARINQKWFYLPPDPKIGFQDKMAVDFMVTLRVPRLELETFRDLRLGRLNDVAYEHFRERIGEFFRRYAYDEWYPLGQEEFRAYANEYAGIEPYPWQRGARAE